MLLKPDELGLLPHEERCHGIYEDMIRRHRSQPTRLFQGQDALHPPITLFTSCPKRALAPLHPKAPGPFSPGIGWCNAVVRPKDPQ